MMKNTLLRTLFALILIITMNGCVSEVNAGSIYPEIERPNFVDERFELMSLITRLGGGMWFTERHTDYQRELDEFFSEFRSHPAVINVRLGADAVLCFAVHIKPDFSGFIDNIEGLAERTGLSEQVLNIGLGFVLDFYNDSDFNRFFQEHIPFYQDETETFIRESFYNDINMDWFSEYGDPSKMRLVISPSFSDSGFAALLADGTVYAGVSFAYTQIIIHEFAHSFTNPIAREWYADNPEFRQWSNHSMARGYSLSTIMAREYVTRAYTILYFADQGMPPFAVAAMLEDEMRVGFPFIHEVYAMITEHERVPMSDLIDWENAERSDVFSTTNYYDYEILWYLLDIPDVSIQGLPINYSSSFFDSQEGDIILTNILHVDYLLIDLGIETTRRGVDGYRAYFRIPLIP